MIWFRNFLLDPKNCVLAFQIWMAWHTTFGMGNKIPQIPILMSRPSKEAWCQGPIQGSGRGEPQVPCLGLPHGSFQVLGMRHLSQTLGLPVPHLKHQLIVRTGYETWHTLNLKHDTNQLWRWSMLNVEYLFGQLTFLLCYKLVQRVACYSFCSSINTLIMPLL